MRTWSCSLPSIGRALLAEAEEGLAAVWLLGKEGGLPAAAGSRKPSPVQAGQEVESPTALLREAEAQLQAYLQGRLRHFDLPLTWQGTAFQQKVWQALQAIPYGETRSYRQIAEAVGCPRGCRAVGMANNRNPLSIIVPCHRVIGAQGQLVGYGSGLWIKRFLLDLEAHSRTGSY